AFGKIEPQLAMRTAFDLLFAEVAQNRTTYRAILQSRVQRAEIGGKGCDMMVVVRRVPAEIVASQLSGRPCLVIGVAKQIVLRNTGVEGGQEVLRCHDYPTG